VGHLKFLFRLYQRLKDFLADRRLFAEQGANASFRYAQAWALVYYLVSQRRPQFVNYLRRLRTRTPRQVAGPGREIEDFRSAFGEPGEDFQGAWVTYILRLPFTPP